MLRKFLLVTGSSGGESYLGSQDNGHRRMSDSQKYPLPTNLNRNRVNKISSSYLNLTREEGAAPAAKEVSRNKCKLRCYSIT